MAQLLFREQAGQFQRPVGVAAGYRVELAAEVVERDVVEQAALIVHGVGRQKQGTRASNGGQR